MKQTIVDLGQPLMEVARKIRKTVEAVGKTIIEVRGRLTTAIQHQVHKVMGPRLPVMPHLPSKRRLQVVLILKFQIVHSVYDNV